MSKPTDKHFKIDLSEYNINGVVSVGAGRGEFARCYHRLGVHQVLWVEQKGYLYGPMYDHIKQFGMEQQQHMVQLMDYDDHPQVRKFLTLWRENAGQIDPYVYDLLHISCKQNRRQIIEGFSFLIDNFKYIVLTGGDGGDFDWFGETLGQAGFNLDSRVIDFEHNSSEALYVKKG
jgi:hypothetical protein